MSKLNKYLGANVLLINQKSLTTSLKSSYPLEKINIGFKIFNTLLVKLEGNQSPLNLQISLTATLPELSLDNLVSTDSALFTKPTNEIEPFSAAQSYLNFDVWDSGLMTPSASSESKIKMLSSEKPDTVTLQSIYKLSKIVEKYLNVDGYFILNKRIFLRQGDQPDIIVNVPFDEDNLVQALQSVAYLSTIKKDAKVIDLRFKNPILR